MSTDVKLKDVRIAFIETLWNPGEFKAGDGKFRHDATFLVAPGSADDKAIEAAIITEAKETFGTKWEPILKSLRGQKTQDCYVDGNTKPYDGFQDMKALSSHRKAKDGAPGVFDKIGTYDEEKKKVVANRLPEGGKLYAGCYVNATIEIYAQKGENPGIRCGLRSVQYCREGDSFGGAKPVSADDFDAEDMSVGADAEEMA